METGQKFAPPFDISENSFKFSPRRMCALFNNILSIKLHFKNACTYTRVHTYWIQITSSLIFGNLHTHRGTHSLIAVEPTASKL